MPDTAALNQLAAIAPELLRQLKLMNETLQKMNENLAHIAHWQAQRSD